MIKSKLSGEHLAFYGFAFITIISALFAFCLQEPAILILPIAVLSAAWIIVDFKQLYYLFFLLLPFSIEIYLPNGLGTDLPSEPIMLVLTGLFFIILFWNGRNINLSFLQHTISKIILLHILWIAVCSITSSNQIISIKYLLAKLWYVVPFYFLPLILLTGKRDYKIIFKALAFTTVIAAAYVIYKHSGYGFSFDKVNKAVRPIFRNHVSYGGLLVCVVPFVWALIVTEKKKWLYAGFMLFLLIATYLTYTRAAYGVLILSVGVYWVIKFRLLKHAAFAGLIVVFAFLGYLIDKNRYIGLAPDYEKTITHKKFDNLIHATYQFEDISTMERLHRWVAGFNMVADKPLFGHGPSTFYSNYRSYTVSSFKTYVSDNPEKSGIHNNYLMVAVEQGLVGLFIMLLVVLLPLFIGEKVYHLIDDPEDGVWLMAAMLCYFIIAVLILINDILEADKVGPFFFFSASIITAMNLKYRSLKRTTE